MNLGTPSWAGYPLGLNHPVLIIGSAAKLLIPEAYICKFRLRMVLVEMSIACYGCCLVSGPPVPYLSTSCLCVLCLCSAASAAYLESFRRYNYTTPKSYLELISLYKDLLARKRRVSAAMPAAVWHLTCSGLVTAFFMNPIN